MTHSRRAPVMKNKSDQVVSNN